MLYADIRRYLGLLTLNSDILKTYVLVQKCNIITRLKNILSLHIVTHKKYTGQSFRIYKTSPGQIINNLSK